MQCPCGGATKKVVSEVKTLKKLLEWFPTATKSDLTAVIERDVCCGCGRQHLWPLTKRDQPYFYLEPS